MVWQRVRARDNIKHYLCKTFKTSIKIKFEHDLESQWGTSRTATETDLTLKAGKLHTDQTRPQRDCYHSWLYFAEPFL